MKTENRAPTPAAAGNSEHGYPAPMPDRRWFAVFTVPQNEKSAVRHLELRDVESFLPTYETVRVWKNRQKVKTVLPLFPTYLFVHINGHERARVLESPGVLQIVGNGREGAVVADADIELLRTGVQGRRAEPYRDLVVGERVRIRSGLMRGVEGTLVRRTGGDRFVLSMKMINQHAALQVDGEDLELIGPSVGDVPFAPCGTRSGNGIASATRAALAAGVGSR